MKLIHNFKSPNFNKRKHNKIELIIIHYTALENINESLRYLCDVKNKVSCHYLISQKGQIYNLVSEKNRAWHAGISYWNLENDINSNSIGIELDYSPNYQNNIFSKKLVSSLIALLKNLKKKYNIIKYNILAHSDVSPYRKIDPGSKFPWNTLYKYNLAFNPEKIKKNKIKSIRNWFKKRNISSKKHITLFMLAYIGYDTSLSNQKNFYYNCLLKNYQNHYLQNLQNSKNLHKTYDLIEKHFCILVLTNLKK